MRKAFLIIPLLILISCSGDSDEIPQGTDNNQPIISVQSFAIDEHAQAGSSIGTVTATDADNDVLTFAISDESGLEINEDSGEITLGNTLELDYEVNQSLSFTVSVFDGKSIVEQSFELTINNINEYELLSDEQRATIDYYQYLTLWEAPTNSPLSNSSRWMQPMRLYLDGQVTTEFREDVEAVLAEYNTIFENSAFHISLVPSLTESNAHLYFGTTADIEGLWSDMFDIIDGQTYSGYAITSNSNSVLSNSRIWVSSPLPILFQHELGHALGLGHSDMCDAQNSFMCSSIDPDHVFLEIERKILAYAYDDDMEPGLTAEEIQTVLANIMFLED